MSLLFFHRCWLPIRREHRVQCCCFCIEVNGCFCHPLTTACLWVCTYVLIFLSTHFLIYTLQAYLYFSFCLWTSTTEFTDGKCDLVPFPHFLFFWLIEILLVCLYRMRDENDSVDRKKDENGREGAGDKKMAEDRKSMRDEIYQNSWSKVKRIWSLTTHSCASLRRRERARWRERRETKWGRMMEGRRH